MSIFLLNLFSCVQQKGASHLPFLGSINSFSRFCSLHICLVSITPYTGRTRWIILIGPIRLIVGSTCTGLHHCSGKVRAPILFGADTKHAHAQRQEVISRFASGFFSAFIQPTKRATDLQQTYISRPDSTVPWTKRDATMPFFSGS